MFALGTNVRRHQGAADVSGTGRSVAGSDYFPTAAAEERASLPGIGRKTRTSGQCSDKQESLSELARRAMIDIVLIEPWVRIYVVQ